ncbi:MAG TPA: hypothetical protein VMT81_02635 [Candidatus Paceibacterota bacterium]|nr:hypothetical protein [Candidatus Paceibacterota bacterium]
MNQILIILGFIALYITARRMAGLKRDNDFGFRPPKKTWWQKLLGK